MKYILLLVLIFQFSFSNEQLTRKIIVSSFNSQKDADFALNVFEENKSTKFKQLEENLKFEVIARKSDKFYVISIEAFKDYAQAKLILDEILSNHPGAYINKYTTKIDSNQKEAIRKEEKKQSIQTITTRELFENIEDKKEEKKILKSETPKYEEKIENHNLDNEMENKNYFFIYRSDDSILFNVKRNLSVYPLIKNSSIIKIEYKDSTATRSSDFINQLMKEYLSQNIEENSKQLKETIEFIEVQLEKEKKELALAERELELFRSENLLFNIDKKVEQINKQKDELQNELLTIERKKKIFDAMRDSLVKGETVSSSALNDLPIFNTIELLNKERSTQQELATKYTSSHKSMITVSNKIKTLENNIITNIRNIDTSFMETKKGLESQINDLNEEILLLPKLAMKLSTLERKFNLKEAIYKDLLLKYNDTSSKYISSKRINRIIDFAQKPETPIKPRISMILIIGFMISLLFAFIIVLIKEFFDKYIKRPSDLTSLTKTPYYGYIPFVKSKNYNKLFILDDLASRESESLRRIRSSLDLSAKKDNSKIVLITSTVSNEGKSTFISNLALMFALSNKRTILIGLDLRIPQLHRKFDIKNINGMSELLSRNIELNDAIQTIKVKDYPTSLDIITSGAIPINPAELIENGVIDEILSDLRKKYDYILIDSTPLALVPDAIPLLTKADTTLFVFKSEYSKKEYVKNTDELIKKFNLKSVGFILTSVKKKYFEELKYDKNYNLFATKSKH